MTTIIRRATAADAAELRRVHMSAFDEGESAEVADLATKLLEGSDSPQDHSWLAETDGTPSGHVAFSEVTLSDAPEVKASILAPLGVRAGFQRLGIGSQLVRHGLRHLTDGGVALVFVYGDPEYYGRFGFTNEAGMPFEAPYPLQYPHGWQAKVLDPEASVPSSGKLSCVAALSDPSLW